MSDTPPVEWFASGRIEPGKMEDYLLSPTHPRGKHKARLWRSFFGLERDDGAVLERLIREQLHQGTPEKKAEEPVPRWEIIIPLFRGPNGNEHPVKTAWALEPGRDRPHLVTAFPDL